MKKYEKYKQSGVQWLGEVPEHWEVKRLKFAINLNPVKSELNEQQDMLVSFVPMEAVNFDKNLTLNQEKILDEVYKGYTYFKNNDVILAKITPCFENGKSAIAQNLTNGIGFGTTELHVLRANSLISNQFLYYFIKSEPFMKIGESEMYGAGGQKRVPEEFIKNFLIGLPSLEEQTAIADFLDRKLGEIDTLISKQQALLEKLAEQRTATITTAVTKGLNPNAPMKQSGVQWLGEVPEHWEMKAIKRVVKEHSGNGFPIELQGDNGNTPFLKVSDLNKTGKFISDFSNSVNLELINEMKWNIVPKFALVTAKIGEALRKNHRKILSQNSVIDNNCIAFECLNINLNYHYYLSLIIDFDWFENGGTIPSLSVQKYKNQKVCIPPLSEQTAIADFLDKETSKIDRLCDTVNQTIERLQEYRTALITQVVTGKIKVV